MENNNGSNFLNDYTQHELAFCVIKVQISLTFDNVLSSKSITMPTIHGFPNVLHHCKNNVMCVKEWKTTLIIQLIVPSSLA